MSRAETNERERQARDARKNRLESIRQAAAAFRGGNPMIDPASIDAVSGSALRVHTATAFRNESVAEIAAVITDYITSFSVSCEAIALERTFPDSSDARIYAPLNGWTVVLWPA